ncbi:hypothetical protein ACJJTC_001787 [Scirpophaga incertulas]
MESLKKLRSILRRFYSNAERDLANAQRDGSDSNIHAMFTIAKQKAEELFSVDEKIKDMWFADIDASEDLIFADLQTADSYKSRWVIVSTNYYRQFQSNVDVASDVASMASHMNTASSDKSAQKRFTLPKIELRKFDGEIGNWISFWGQFSKIHNDADIDDSDKYQYLVQATVQGSKARELVESFPTYGKNYHKAIEQLKDRFAREDLLIENYIRGLLQLILAQDKQLPLDSLYDKLSTHIKLLFTLFNSKSYLQYVPFFKCVPPNKQSDRLFLSNVVHVHEDLYAVETKLGWSLQGVIPYNSHNISSYISINFNVTDYWELETLVIKEPCDKIPIESGANTYKFFRETVTTSEEGCYEISLPWKEGFPQELSETNKPLSQKRLYSTTKRLVSLNYLQKYDQVLKDWVAEGIIKEVVGNENGLYLPHHAVIKESSVTTPVRPVFDASAKDRFGNSLNS